MTREKIEEAGVRLVRGWPKEGSGVLVKRRCDSPHFSPIQLDATNPFHSILLRHALLIFKLLPYRAGRAHVRHGHHHSTSQAILGGDQDRLPHESTGDSCTS